jgi:3-hydroxyisobutyrate dehydrogenase
LSEQRLLQIGFIGLGIMGRNMAGHLQRAGHALHVYNRSRGGAKALMAAGATWHDAPGDVAARSDIVITMVGLPSDVEAVYLGSGGLVERARPGTVLVDMTTSSPELAQRIAAAAQARGADALDAPVSGGEIGARDAKLSIMVGGSRNAFDRALPVLRLMGPTVVLQGGPGSGQHTKMCNQIVIASTMLGVCEGLAYAQRSGLDPQTVLNSISGGAAGSFLLTNMAPRMLKGDFSAGFFTEHFIKDMGIALQEAQRMQLELPGLALAKRLYDQLAALGHGRDGTQVLSSHTALNQRARERDGFFRRIPNSGACVAGVAGSERRRRAQGLHPRMSRTAAHVGQRLHGPGDHESRPDQRQLQRPRHLERSGPASRLYADRRRPGWCRRFRPHDRPRCAGRRGPRHPAAL